MKVTAPKEFLRNVFPQNEPLFWRFLWWLALAALIRLAFLPFFAHIDFFSECRRIFYFYDNGTIYPGSRFITSLFQLINMTLWSPLIAEKSSMFYMLNPAASTASHLQFFGFIQHEAILRTLLILKLPYLLFDLLIALVLYHFNTDRKSSMNAVLVWLFNPISFFAFYIFSRYESIPLFFLILSLLMLKQRRLLAAFIAFGLAIWSREIIIILAPFFVLYVIRQSSFSWREWIPSGIILALFFGFATNIIPSLMGIQNPFIADNVSLADVDQSVQLLGFQLVWYFPFITAISALGIWMLIRERVEFQMFLAVLGLFYCAFFVLVMHSVHYVSWATLIFAALGATDMQLRKTFYIFCGSWVIFWLFASDLGVFTHWLAAPSSSYWVNIPVFPEVAQRIILEGTAFKLHLVIPALRSLYAACLIVMAVLIIKNMRLSTSAKKLQHS